VSRVALVGPIHPLRGGIALHTARWATALRQAGHEVQVFSFERQYPGVLFPGTTQFDTDDPVCDLGNPPPQAILDSIGPRSWQATVRALQAYDPDVLVLQRWHPFFAPALTWLARALGRARVRIVWMVHNARPHDGPAWLWGPLARLGYAPEDLCLVHAPSEARALRDLGVTSPIETIEHPAPEAGERVTLAEARSSLAIDPEEVVFLFFGHVRRYKGVEVLLEALAPLRGHTRPWRALIVGEWYYDRAPAMSYIESAGLAAQVEVVDDFVSEAEAARYFAASTVVVLPYREGTQSGVVPQAFANRRPVIATDVGAVAVAIRDGENGRVVPANQPLVLGDALREVLDGKEFSDASIAAASAAASWEPMVDVVVGAIRDTASD
jgi:D-inositol-3-phosphate glycosyltransferase